MNRVVDHCSAMQYIWTHFVVLSTDYGCEQIQEGYQKSRGCRSHFYFVWGIFIISQLTGDLLLSRISIRVSPQYTSQYRHNIVSVRQPSSKVSWGNRRHEFAINHTVFRIYNTPSGIHAVDCVMLSHVFQGTVSDALKVWYWLSESVHDMTRLQMVARHTRESLQKWL